MGFKDGTANLDAADAELMARNVWATAGDGQAWMAGGSYLVSRRVRIRIEAWDRTPTGEQETIFGRRKATGAPLGGHDEHDPGAARRAAGGRPHPARQSPHRRAPASASGSFAAATTSTTASHPA